MLPADNITDTLGDAMAGEPTMEQRIARSQSLTALASYFRSSVALSDPSLRFLPASLPPPRADSYVGSEEAGD